MKSHLLSINKEFKTIASGKKKVATLFWARDSAVLYGSTLYKLNKTVR
jgi:hypothetical protein